jgi:choline-sulfatase
LRRAGSAAALLAAALEIASCGRRAASPPVVLISVDTLRADHLPAYGYRQVETPNLDALARESIVFENAYCQVPLTLPSHAVILTGQPPYKNGVRDNIGFRVSPSTPTLAALLKGAGYATGAAVSSLALRADRGLDAGFDLYDDRFTRDSPDERPGPATVEALEKWMDTVPGRPLFLFLHLYEPHTPYAPPEPFRQRYAARPYDGEIAAADAAVGRFLQDLKRRGLYDPALLIFLSDHGEGLGDHGEDEHGVFLYREAIHVPLFVKLPGRRREGERVTRPVGLLDLYPTIASAVGLSPPDGLDGVDLLGPGERNAQARRIYSETLYPRLALGWSELFSLTDARYEYIEAPRVELYDLAADPGQRHDLASGKPEPLRAMRAELAKIPRVSASPERSTPEEIERLGSLGYISVSRGASGGGLPDPKDRIGALRKYKRLFELYYAKQDALVVAAAGEILADEPGMISVWRMRAVSRERLGDLPGAVRDLETGFAKCPDATLEQRSEMVEQLAAILVRAGKASEAERVLREAVAGSLATDSMRVALARLLSETGRAEEASKLLPPASPAEDGSVADARGVAAAESGRYEEARRNFLSALAKEPDNTAVLLHLGMLCLRQRDAAGARDWFEKALARQPDAPGTLMAMGLAQVELRDEAGAYESWSKATRLDPSQYDALFNLAMLSGRMGRTGEARKALERFVATAPPDRYAGQIAQARRLLKALSAGKG